MMLYLNHKILQEKNRQVPLIQMLLGVLPSSWKATRVIEYMTGSRKVYEGEATIWLFDNYRGCWWEIVHPSNWSLIPLTKYSQLWGRNHTIPTPMYQQLRSTERNFMSTHAGEEVATTSRPLPNLSVPHHRARKRHCEIHLPCLCAGTYVRPSIWVRFPATRVMSALSSNSLSWSNLS